MTRGASTGTDQKIAFLAKKWRIPRDEARRLLNTQRAEGYDD